MNEQTQRWPGFKYEQVPGLANRHISRYLRTQRKNMRAFFNERGLIALTLRMDAIKKSNAGMMEKNRKFQGVLDDYARIAGGTPAGAGAEAADLQAEGDGHVGVSPDSAGVAGAEGAGSGADAGDSVPPVEAGDAGIVVDE